MWRPCNRDFGFRDVFTEAAGFLLLVVLAIRARCRLQGLVRCSVLAS
jgi:hypothetical protein